MFREQTNDVHLLGMPVTDHHVFVSLTNEVKTLALPSWINQEDAAATSSTARR